MSYASSKAISTVAREELALRRARRGCRRSCARASRVGLSVRRMPSRSWRSPRSCRPTSPGLAFGDEILELVDLVVEAVDQVEVALGDLVDEVVDEHADVFVRLARLLRRSRVERLLARRRLRDRDELLRRHDEVDLLVVEAILARDRDREQEDAEDVVAVRLDARPRLVVVDVRREQRRERRRLRCRPAGALAAPPRSDRRGRSSAGASGTSGGYAPLRTGRCLPVRRQRGAGMAFERGEVPLGVERAHTARAGGRDRLAVDVILHVADGEHAGDVRLGRARLRDQVAVLVVVELVEEELSCSGRGRSRRRGRRPRPRASRRSRCCAGAARRPSGSPSTSSTRTA